MMYHIAVILILMTSTISSNSVFQFNVKDVDNKEISLSNYQGKVLLIVNTASECGFTPQYEELEKLYQMFKNKGFEVLAFPSNDFGGQEPLNGKELQHFCSLNYHTTFPVFNKIHVKGPQIHPLYKFLSNKQENGVVDVSPKWNFHKYLIDKNGKVVDYYLSTTSPTSSKIKNAIESLLKK